jgi:hypothetical protein
MSVAEYEAMPETLTVREVRVQVTEPGFRVESLVVTTLTDAVTYPKEEISDLYRHRWQVDLSHPDYRSRECLYLGGWAA